MKCLIADETTEEWLAVWPNESVESAAYRRATSGAPPEACRLALQQL